jgi:Phage major capsid protein E
MANISLSQALGQYTSKLVDVYKQKNTPTNFLRSFFPTKVMPTKLISIQVQRSYEQAAVDVYRGTEGNRNQWSKSSEKLFEPVYFRENFDLTQLQVYDMLFQPNATANPAMMALFINSVVDNQIEQQEKIERSIEIMCAQVLQTGIIEMSSQGTGTIIDFKRKSGSIVDPGSGNYWANNVDPFEQIKDRCIWLRKYGKTAAMSFDMICGDDAITDLYQNTKFLDRLNKFHLNIDNIVPPQAQVSSIGGVFHGQITAGPYRVNIWSYPQYHDVVAADGSFTSTPYLNPKLVTIIPSGVQFNTYFGAVPQVVQPGATPVIGDFVTSDWISQEKRAHLYEVESCPIPVPVKVDQITNLQAVA